MSTRVRQSPRVLPVNAVAGARSSRHCAAKGPRTSQWFLVCLLSLVPFWAGCAACRPLHGLPVRYLPEELKSTSRSEKKTIDLSLLRQTPQADHLIDSGDVLAIYIEGVLGRREEIPPVFVPARDDTMGAPSLGYPIPVRSDGTISLPLNEPIRVRGMTIQQAEHTIREAYVNEKEILKPGRERIFVSLQRPRSYRVLVIRQEAGGEAVLNGGGGQGQYNPGTAKRGSGRLVTLPAYKNDVLHALAETGGLPGLDAENTIYVIRRKPSTTTAPAYVPEPQLGRPPELIPPSPPFGVSSKSSSGVNSPSDVHLASATQPNRIGHVGATPTRQFDARRPPRATQPAPGIHVSSQPAGGSYRTQAMAYTNITGASYRAAHTANIAPQSSSAGWSNVPHVPNRSPDIAHDATSAPAPYASDTSTAWSDSRTMGESQPIPETDGTWSDSLAGATFGINQSTIDDNHIIKIPIRLGPGDIPQFGEQDVVLLDGDIVFIESRETEVFYSGGLLGGGQYTLPRDYDLDVLGAVAIAESQQSNQRSGRQVGGVSALNGDVTVSASRVVIIRQLPNGTQFPIEVDLYETLRNPEERIIIQPGDYVLLQYTKTEACAAFVERHLIEGALFGIAAAQFNNNGRN